MHAMPNRPLQQRPFGDQLVELISRHEVVVHTVDLTRSRRAGGDRNRDEDLWVFVGGGLDDSCLAPRGGTRDYRETRRAHVARGGVDRSENSAIRAAVWCLPRPRNRRLGAVSSRSVALLGPTGDTRA